MKKKEESESGSEKIKREIEVFFNFDDFTIISVQSINTIYVRGWKVSYIPYFNSTISENIKPCILSFTQEELNKCLSEYLKKKMEYSGYGVGIVICNTKKAISNYDLIIESPFNGEDSISDLLSVKVYPATFKEIDMNRMDDGRTELTLQSKKHFFFNGVYSSFKYTHK